MAEVEARSPAQKQRHREVSHALKTIKRKNQFCEAIASPGGPE